MSVRRNLLAAVRWIVPVVIVVAAGSAPPLHAQSEGAPASNAAPDTAPSIAPAAQSSNGAVFDAPGLPGVRMMAPIPDGSHEPSVVQGGQVVIPAGAEPPVTALPASASPSATIAAPGQNDTGAVFNAPNM